MTRIDILNKIIEEQQKVIDNLKLSVERYKTASDIDEDDTLDPDDFSRQTEAKEMQLHFEKLLAEAEFNQNKLISEKENSYSSIENGALIETDKAYLFIGISLPLFKINDKNVLCFSNDAPVFSKIKNKNIEDIVNIGVENHKILSIS